MNNLDLKNKNVTVIGAAESGVSVAKLLKRIGANVFVSDIATSDKLKSYVSELEASNIDYELGKHSDKVYQCELMVVSPGVPGNSPVILEARKRDIRIISELELGSWFCRAPIVAITGSNGKTTTTTLIGRILKNAEKKHIVAGNISPAFTSIVLGLAETDIAVLEVSSFQLDDIESFHPSISVLLNITPDHMDRYHNSMENYSASKARIFKNQSGDDVLIYNVDDEWTVKTVSRAKCKKLGFSVKMELIEGAFIENNKLVSRLSGKKEEVIDIDRIFIKGIHNLYNSMAATLTCLLLGVEVEVIQKTLEEFRGVEHRLEYFAEVNGVKFYNDSKATNVDSVWYALRAFKQPIILLLGGRDKGNDYSRLYDLVKDKVKVIIAIGESADKVVNSFSHLTHVEKASSMEQAVFKAYNFANSGDIVLLSPACASFDWFENYEHRGRIFKELVSKLAKKGQVDAT